MEEKKLYMLVYHYLLARIYFKFYPKGEYLPSIQNLADQFGLSTMTVRGALRLLEEDGFISNDKNRRSVILGSPEEPSGEFPQGILIRGDILIDLYRSLELLYPDVFYYGLLSFSRQTIQEQRSILEYSAASWDEPTMHFLACMVQGLNNSLLSELYNDIMLFSYPTYLYTLAMESKRWKNAYRTLHEKLGEMLDLKEHGGSPALRSLIGTTYRTFDPIPLPGKPDLFHSHPYRWRNSQLCRSVARGLIYQVSSGAYPAGTYLPSARILAQNSSMAVITVRRAIALLNDLGVTESDNGVGTRILSREQGLKKIKWTEPAVKRNIILYLESLHIIAVTCRTASLALFPLISKEERMHAREELRSFQIKGYDSVLPSLCINTLMNTSSLSAFNEIYSQLLELLIWGYPLAYLQPALDLACFFEPISLSLERGDSQMFGRTLQQAISAIFLSSKAKALSVGIEEALRLNLPFSPEAPSLYGENDSSVL